MSNADEYSEKTIASGHHRARVIGLMAAMMAGSGSNPYPASRGMGFFHRAPQGQRGIRAYRAKRKAANKRARIQRRVNRARARA